MLLQPTHHYHSNNASHALDANRHAAAVNGILPSLHGVHAKLGRKSSLVAFKLAVHEPRADAKAEHGRALAAHPHLVVRRGVAARHALVERLAARGGADGDESRAGGRKGQQARVQEVAQLEGVFGCEGGEGEASAADIGLEELLDLKFLLARHFHRASRHSKGGDIGGKRLPPGIRISSYIFRWARDGVSGTGVARGSQSLLEAMAGRKVSLPDLLRHGVFFASLLQPSYAGTMVYCRSRIVAAFKTQRHSAVIRFLASGRLHMVIKVPPLLLIIAP